KRLHRKSPLVCPPRPISGDLCQLKHEVRGAATLKIASFSGGNAVLKLARTVARMSAPHQRVYAHDGARYPGASVPHIAISREERDLAHPPKPAFGAKAAAGYKVRVFKLKPMRAAFIQNRSNFARVCVSLN